MAKKITWTRTSEATGSVPLVSDWRAGRVFADVGRAGIGSPARMLEGWARQREPEGPGGLLEAAVHEWETVPAGLLALLAQHRRSVARVCVPVGLRDYRGVVEGPWTGTGFLVGPNLLLTNHHVLNSAEVAAAATAEFDFELPADRLASPAGAKPPTAEFKLAPGRLFVTSEAMGGGLDFTFVWIGDEASKIFGSIPMQRGSFMATLHEPTFVIHHPKGRLKEVSLNDTEVLGINATCLLYAADTDKGSSGACVINRNGRLVALHHARREGADLADFSGETALRLKDGRDVSVANEGIKISAIALELERRARAGTTDAEGAMEVLRHIGGSDTLTGIFGGLGRRAESNSDRNRVLGLYEGTNQDIDLGFWNLNWLLSAQAEPEQLTAMAAAMVDLNLDVWCLTEAPPAAVGELLATLERHFGEEFEVHYADPAATRLRLTTAVIWRRSTVTCEPVTWPPALDGVWTHEISDLPPGQDGRTGIFAEVPPLLRLRIAGDSGEPSAHVVPISFRAVAEDDARRRLGSMLMVRAIDLANAAGVAGSDWIVGGDFRPPLAREDSVSLETGAYRAIAARDNVRGGGISYLRSETSLVWKVYVTSDLTPLDDDQKFLEVVPERTVDQFFRILADNRPAVLRLSLRGETDVESSLRDVLSRVLHERTPVAATDWSEGLQFKDLSKPEFLRRNRQVLLRLAQHVTDSHGIGAIPLTEADLWVIIFVEAGLKNGIVDPDARHSLGERGLLPLPENIRFWIGPDAPDWAQPMPLRENLESYARYLASIKNRVVNTSNGRALYRDLFLSDGIVSSPVRQAKLLAGVVHGYFVRSNYGGQAVPFEHILQGYRADRPVDVILAGTGYVHADTAILIHRQRNIDDALAALARSRSK